MSNLIFRLHAAFPNKSYWVWGICSNSFLKLCRALSISVIDVVLSFRLRLLWQIVIFSSLLHTNKNVEPVLCPVYILKALALPCPSNRATLKAPRRCIYHIPSCDGYNNYTSGAFSLPWFMTFSSNLRDSQDVKPKASRKRL